jgi:hypothetical protein
MKKSFRGKRRAALERMMRIHRMIEDGEYPNCTRMAGVFEMRVRTLKQDNSTKHDWPRYCDTGRKKIPPETYILIQK